MPDAPRQPLAIEVAEDGLDPLQGGDRSVDEHGQTLKDRLQAVPQSLQQGGRRGNVVLGRAKRERGCRTSPRGEEVDVDELHPRDPLRSELCTKLWRDVLQSKPANIARSEIECDVDSPVVRCNLKSVHTPDRHAPVLDWCPDLESFNRLVEVRVIVDRILSGHAHPEAERRDGRSTQSDDCEEPYLEVRRAR